MGDRIRPTEDVSLVDAAGVATRDAAHVFLANRDLREERSVTVESPGDGPATVTVLAADDPFAENTDWNGGTAPVTTTERETTAEGGVTVSLPPAAVARVAFDAQ